MPEPRIIFLNRVYWPSTAATAQLLTDLAEGLAARGRDVQVIAAGESSTRQNGVTIHRTGTAEQHGGLISRALNHRRFLWAAQRQLVTLARSGDIIVPLSDPPMLSASVAEHAAKVGAHTVPWIQDIYPEIAAAHFGPIAGFLLSPFKTARDSAWRAADTCVTLGDDMARFVGERGLPAERIAVMPNWAPRELHAPALPEAIAAQRAQWGLAGKFVIAYSGNLGRVHEFSTILQAASLLRADADIVFLFIGQGARFDTVRTVVSDEKLANVRLIPPEPRANLAASLAAADAHLVTLRPDYASLVYPSKLAGVLAAGRPVLFVGPPGGDIAKLLARDNCGSTFAPGDAAGLAATIKRWQSDADACTRIGVSARATYEREFSFATALARWAALLGARVGQA